MFEKKHRNGNHTDVVSLLGNKNITSLYHDFFKEEQGKESQPTFYWRKNRSLPYHIDFCFGTDVFLSRLNRFEVGQIEDWIDISDHMPIIVDFIR